MAQPIENRRHSSHIQDIAPRTACAASPLPAIVRLNVTDFRNHAATRLEVGRETRFVVLTGPNGAGKTNLLEAISLLAPGRGMRRAAFADMVRHGSASGWAVAAQVSGLAGEVRIGMAFSAASDDQKRQVRLDGQSVRSAGVLGEHLRLSWLTPAMDGLFAASASHRRRFLDRLTLAFEPAHASRVVALDKLLRQRNRLLENLRANAAWLDAVEAQLAEVAVAVAAGRISAVTALAEAMKNVESPDFPFPSARLRLEGWVENRLAESPAVQVEDAYRQRLAESRREDAAAGRTLTGPHRSDLLVTHAAKDMPARLCSTGEQKALLVAIILAHAHAVRARLGGHPPLLLLDEVAAHLDGTRRQGLFAALAALGGQVWMTGTDAGLFAGLAEHAPCAAFHVEDGQVRPQT